jgi:hypothetical protein
MDLASYASLVRRGVEVCKVCDECAQVKNMLVMITILVYRIGRNKYYFLLLLSFFPELGTTRNGGVGRAISGLGREDRDGRWL